jgi:ParB family chromosome partitioning protein
VPQLRRRHFGSRAPINLLEVIQPRATTPEPTVRLALDRIDPSGRNPRRALAGLTELADSIEAYGLLQPVVVRARGPRYELIAGHRRFAALQLLAARDPGSGRWRAVDAVVRQENDDEAYLLMLTENLQREDLRPREEAAALEVLVRERGWSVRRVAQAIKMSPAYVSNRLRVFDDPILAPLVLAGQLGVSMAEELLRASGGDRQHLAELAIAEGWDRRRLRAERDACLAAKHPEVASERGLARQLQALREILTCVQTAPLSDVERLEAKALLVVLSRLVAENDAEVHYG